MNRNRWVKAVRILLPLAGVVMLVIWFVYRPWALSWGATPEEIAGLMPGDAIVANPGWCATRAVTVDAPAASIWPWLVQMGYLKAGFYSYDRLDNDGVPSAESIIPEYQDLEVGGLIPLSKTSHVRVVEMDRPLSMVWVFVTTGGWSDATWVWVLTPKGPDRTRLLTRLRVGPVTWRQRLFLDLGEIVMMRKCMLGIKRRAESMDSTATAPQPRGRR